MIKSDEYRSFLDEAYVVYLKQGSPKYRDEYPLDVKLFLYPPSTKAYDTDNRIKPTLDALTKVGFWGDDSIEKRITAEACVPVERGAVAIVVDYFTPSALATELISWFHLRPLKTKGEPKK